MKILWGDFPSHPTNQRKKVYMLAVILKNLLEFILSLSIIFGLVFMMACTAFVIICFGHGDIKISITRNKAENEKK